MKKTFTFLFILSLMITSFSFIKEKDTKNNSQTVRIIIAFDKKFDDGSNFKIDFNFFKSIILKKLLKQNNVKTIDAVFKNRYINDKLTLNNNIIESDLEKDIVYRQLTITNNFEAEKIKSLLKEEKYIKDVYFEEPVFLKRYITANDSLKNDQWYLNGQFGISIDNAWDINMGRNDIIIAVCDGGIDYTHPDLDSGNRNRVIQGYDSGDKDNDPCSSGFVIPKQYQRICNSIIAFVQ